MMHLLPSYQYATVRPGRIARLMGFGFTQRQAEFIGYVLAFSGVFVERQYRTFAGLVHGQRTHDFLASLVERGYATVITPGALHRGRLYHVHHKPLYEAIDDPDNRHRKPAALGRWIARLMALDAVLADRRYHWLGTERDKVAYFRAALEGECDRHILETMTLPRATFGTGPEKTTRYFPDKMPIGFPGPEQRHHIFLYVATEAVPTHFRDFLLRHVDLLKPAYAWVIRVVLPRRFRKAASLYRYAIRDVVRPLSNKDCDELEWYFAARDGRPPTPVSPYGLDLKTAAVTYGAARFEALYRAWRHEREQAIWKVRMPILHDQLERRQSHIEFAELPYQYLQLTPLLESTAVRDQGLREADDLGPV